MKILATGAGKLLLVLFASLTLYVLSSVVVPRAHAQETEPLAVVNIWVDAIVAGEYGMALDALDEGAFLILSDPALDTLTNYEGKVAIAEVLDGYRRDGVSVELVESPVLVMGTAIWTERQRSNALRSLGVDFIDMGGEALVRGGKIVSIIYTPTPESVQKIADALGQPGTMPTGMPRSGFRMDVVWLALIGCATFVVGYWVNRLNRLTS